MTIAAKGDSAFSGVPSAKQAVGEDRLPAALFYIDQRSIV